MAEVEAFEARHPIGTMARLAMDLFLYTGLRRSDVVRVGPQHIAGDVLSIQPVRTHMTDYMEKTQMPPKVRPSFELTVGRHVLLKFNDLSLQ